MKELHKSYYRDYPTRNKLILGDSKKFKYRCVVCNNLKNDNGVWAKVSRSEVKICQKCNIYYRKIKEV